MFFLGDSYGPRFAFFAFAQDESVAAFVFVRARARATKRIIMCVFTFPRNAKGGAGNSSALDSRPRSPQRHLNGEGGLYRKRHLMSTANNYWSTNIILNKSKIPARPVPRRRPLPPRPFTGNEALKAPPSRPSSPAPSASSSHASQDVCLLRNHKPEVALNRRDKPNRRELTRVFFSFFFFWLAVHSWFIITCSSQGSRG